MQGFLLNNVNKPTKATFPRRKMKTIIHGKHTKSTTGAITDKIRILRLETTIFAGYQFPFSTEFVAVLLFVLYFQRY